MKNDQNLTHVKSLCDDYFGTSQFKVFEQYTIIH